MSKINSSKEEAEGSKIMIRDDDFLKYDANDKPDEDSLPLSNSLADAEDNQANFSHLLEQSKLFSKRSNTNQETEKTDHNGGDPVERTMGLGNQHNRNNGDHEVDLFKPQE